MLKRRTFLQYMVAAPAAIWLNPHALANSEFERFKREQNQEFLSEQSAWQTYQRNYATAFRTYQNTLSLVWNKPEISGQTTWVNYSTDLHIRRIVDFEKNEVRLSFSGSNAAKISEASIRAEFEKTLSTTVHKAYLDDPILTQSAGKNAPSSQYTVAGTQPSNINTLLNNAKREQTTTIKGPVMTVTVPLPATAIPERAQLYLPLIHQHAAHWQIEPTLVLAIMQAESAFNPMARSHVPAFGLMQIVPGTAGRDATKKAWGRETLLSGAQLFNPATNIELGCAYLNLLSTHYLAAIKHPISRQYCVIAAYNTGAGNVARAFVGTNAMKDAAKRINAMSPEQVFAHLRRHLPYTETKNYLVKVTDTLRGYRA